MNFWNIILYHEFLEYHTVVQYSALEGYSTGPMTQCAVVPNGPARSLYEASQPQASWSASRLAVRGITLAALIRLRGAC